jgi:hypothetical protein
MECVFCGALHRRNLNFAVNPAKITVKCLLFAIVFRVQPVLFQQFAESLLQDDLQVAN